ncbi:hypothetical protein FHL15_010824 [Xylaria flabelliformis]|uniref:Nephrocystin 3-like N-terminal domain-containing protein n=1 Tax=Xylaria flabelliformis TaxID=2512241 RepID=A0A553HJY5_9PEZI|nr:hypothetical protein FHL15_010824 [Xylaria flabelliformis]
MNSFSKIFVSIVFVHGFTGDPVKTWQYAGQDVVDKPKPVKDSNHRWRSRLFQTPNNVTDESQSSGTYWPRDLLPLTVTDARILTFGYDTHIRHVFAGQISQNSVYDMSWDFLVALEAQRKEHVSRPIIFIVHSLGGIVVKEMLRRSDGCHGSRQFLRSIVESTHGIIFFGTPHGGADPRSFLLRIAESAVKVAGFSVNEKIVSTLLPSSERLRELRDEFGPLAMKYNWIIHSFQEQYGVAMLSGKKVVDDGSSYLNLPTVEITEHIARNHMEMCRFSSSNDPEYIKVVAAVDRMVQALRQNGTSQKQHRAAVGPSLSEIKKSLAFEHDMTRFEAIAAEHHRTCGWLLEKPEYLDWLNGANYQDHHGILWIRGKPGAGKSTLTKYAFKQARQSENFTYVISFFFNARGTEFEKTTVGLYRSLITQLLDQLPTKEVRSMLPPKIPKWNVEALQDFLKSLMGEIPQRHKLVWYIDALDECEEDSIREMVSFFEELGHIAAKGQKNFYVWFSSRHYPYISVQHSCTFVLEDANGHSLDLKTYMDDKLRIGSSQPAQEVKIELLSKASGVFLWLALVVPMLNKEFDYGRLHALKQRLRDIPSDLHALFQDMITRSSHSKVELELCLRWILYARQPLSIWQLYHGILTGTNVEPEIISELNDTHVSDDVVNRFIIDASMGLAEIVETPKYGERVQFIHESVRDFLLKLNGLKTICSDEESYCGTSHDIIRRCCATYIDNYSTMSLLHKPNLEHFISYAVENLFWHSEMAQEAGVSQVKFLSTYNLESWCRLGALIDNTAYKQARRVLYILAAEGCSHLISATTWAVSPFETGTEPASTPWRAALRSGSLETVKSLVEIEVRQHAVDGAFQNWNEERVVLYESLFAQMLKYKQESDHKYANETIMFDAARDGDVELLRFLLKTKRFKVNERDPYGRTILNAAARSKGCIELLLSVEDINVNFRDNIGQTAIFMPSIGGRLEIVNFLLSTPGFLADIRDKQGRTALSYAAGTWMEQDKTVQALINSDQVNPDSKDHQGRTPFSYAAEKGHLKIMQLLMDTGKVKPDSKDNHGLSCKQWFYRGCKDRGVSPRRYERLPVRFRPLLYENKNSPVQVRSDGNLPLRDRELLEEYSASRS